MLRRKPKARRIPGMRIVLPMGASDEAIARARSIGNKRLKEKENAMLDRKAQVARAEEAARLLERRLRTPQEYRANNIRRKVGDFIKGSNLFLEVNGKRYMLEHSSTTGVEIRSSPSMERVSDFKEFTEVLKEAAKLIEQKKA
ncbi:MAG TPA: hypothetical protein VI977_03000 [archaeon]|nr:hypothetical protein [archaeon]